MKVSDVIEKYDKIIDSGWGFLVFILLVTTGFLFLPWYLNILIFLYIVYSALKIDFSPAILLTYIFSTVLSVIIVSFIGDIVVDTQSKAYKIKYIDESIIVLDNNVTITNKEDIYECLYHNCNAIKIKDTRKYNNYTTWNVKSETFYEIVNDTP